MREIRRWLRHRHRRFVFLMMQHLIRVNGFASARRIGRRVADFQFRLAWRARRRHAHDLALLLGRPAGDPSVRRLLHEAYCVTTVAVLETLAMFDRRLDDAVLNAQCEVDGIEHLRTALAAGRGAILMAAHMGNGAILAARLARAGFPVSIVYRPVRMMSTGIDERGLSFYGIEGILANAGIRAYSRMLDALRRGRIVFVTMDQGTKVAKDGIVMRFLGKDMPMPAGPVQLARHSGAPILPLWTIAAEPVWRFTIGAPVRREPGSNLEAEVEQLVHLTEQHILKYPHLWSWHHRRWRNFPMASMLR